MQRKFVIGGSLGSIVVLILVLAIIKIGDIDIPFFKITRAKAEFTPPERALTILTKLHERQESDHVTIRFFYKQGEAWIQCASPVIQISKGHGEKTETVILPGSGTFKYVIESTPVVNLNSIRVSASASSEGSITVKNDTKLEYGIETLQGKLVATGDGVALQGLRPFLTASARIDADVFARFEGAVELTPSLTGRWAGSFLLADVKFPIVLTLNQNGKDITGSATSTDPRFVNTSATMDLKGTFDGRTFKFEETRMASSTGKGQWPLKTVTSNVSTAAGTTDLAGTWQAGGFAGKITLRKQ